MRRLSINRSGIASILAWIALLALPVLAFADSGILWSLGPSLTAQNTIHAGALISDSQVFVFRQDQTDATAKQINTFMSTDFGFTLQGSLTSGNTGLATGMPNPVLSAAYYPSRATWVLAGTAASGTNVVLYGSGFTWALGTITGLTGTAPVAHSVVVQGSTVIMLVQTSTGGWLCRATSPTATAISFTCQAPLGIGSFSTLTSTTATGTVQGLAALPGRIWLALDNSNQVWRSIDDGVTWTRANAGAVLTTNTVLANAILCLSPSTCVALVSSSAATQILTFQSTDFGVTWTQRLNVARADQVTNLVAAGQGVVLALGDPFQSAIPMGYRSRDLGVTWDPIPPQNLVNPVGGASFVSHQSTFVTSTQTVVTSATLCTGATCTSQIVRAPIVPGTDPPTTANQGAPASVGNAWPVKVTDGVRTANVKAAATAATTADPAFVVALSPNSLLPTTGGIIGTVTSAQGPGVSISGTGAWPVRISDGANGVVPVKPPFVSPTAADRAFVVAMAPPSSPWPILARQATTGVAFPDVTVTSSSTALCGGVGPRLVCHCTNSGTVNFRIGIGATPTATAGDQIRPGGSFSTTATAQVNAISEGANTTASCGSEG